MKSKINLKWAKSEMPNNFNFGDDLSPYIIHKLTGRQVRYIQFANTRANIIKEFLRGIVRGKLTFNYIKAFFISFFAKYYIISIGSIIQWYGSKRCIVWGAGAISKQDKIKNSKFLAIRGQYTAEIIKKQNQNPPKVLGDPALLLPLIFSPKTSKKYKLGIIPHITHYKEISSKKFPKEILIINLNSPDIEYVINNIVSCEFTISTSLHGIIVSHVYGIKSLWFLYEKISLAGDNMKFLDYFSSVNIPEYTPFIFNTEEIINYRKIIDLILNNENINQIHSDIRKIQTELLRVAPFNVKPEFLKI